MRRCCVGVDKAGTGQVVLLRSMERPVCSSLALKCQHSTNVPSIGGVQARVKSWQEVQALVFSRSECCWLVRLSAHRLNRSVMYVVTHQFHVLPRKVDTATATVYLNTSDFQRVLECVFVSMIMRSLTHVRRSVSPGVGRCVDQAGTEMVVMLGNMERSVQISLTFYISTSNSYTIIMCAPDPARQKKRCCIHGFVHLS